MLKLWLPRMQCFFQIICEKVAPSMWVKTASPTKSSKSRGVHGVHVPPLSACMLRVVAACYMPFFLVACSLYVYVCILYIYVYLYIYISIFLYFYIIIYISIYLYIYISIYLYIYISWMLSICDWLCDLNGFPPMPVPCWLWAKGCAVTWPTCFYPRLA